MKRTLPAAFALGAATVAGFEPFGLFPLPVVTLALLFRLWRGASPRGAGLLGFCWGVGFFFAGVSWVYVSLHDVGRMAMPLAALATFSLCLLLALFPALAGYAWARYAPRTGWRDAGLAAGLWMLSDWVRGWLLTGFPWLALGYSQTPPSPLAGYAPVLGSYGVGFIVALLAAASVFNARRLGTALLFAAVVAGGFLLRAMTWTQPIGAPLKVALLQGNIAQGLKWDPAHLMLSLETYARLAQRTPAALTVLPETAIPLFFDELPRELLQDLTRHGDVLLGVAVRMRGEDGRTSGYANAAVAVARHGEGDFVTQGYAKRHLVPFGEFIPPGFGWFFGLVNIPMSDFTAGPPLQAPLAVAGQTIAPNICYEDLFGEEIIRALPAATLLVNLSNTAWFGRSLAQPQHLQISRMRAVETGRPMLRATNTGMTAAIAPDGTVVGVLEPFTTDVLVVEVQGYGGMTPFARYGNAFAVTLALLVCLAAARQRRLTLPER
jgi:apolipoprotein N-acyltransferase